MTWSVSQGTSLRRVHVEGGLNVTDGTESSGGFLADSKVDSNCSKSVTATMALQKRYLGNLVGIAMEHGIRRRLKSAFRNLAELPITIVTNTPLIREKPYLY